MPAEVMQDLFAYGTLMCVDIMRAASGCPEPAGSTGLLRDHCRLCVRGEHYPGLVPRTGSSVEGTVYHNVPADAWRRLDRFEGDLYLRASVTVELPDTTIRRVQTYLVRPELAGCLEDRVWELEDFLRHGRAEFVSAYPGYAAIATTPGTA
jgi:gamma-glutamylcyclotransferase (GGCT)/AIG2-like uncharacterized protein YtfP